MIIPTKLPMGFTIFCDDIRYELGGKISLIGVYQDGLFADHLPIKLPRLFACVMLRDESHSNRSFNVKLILQNMDDGSEEILQQSTVQFSANDEDAEFDETITYQFQEHHCHFEVINFTATTRSLLKVRAYHGDDEYRLGAIDIDRWEEPSDQTMEASD